jgi:hypothetical protein
MQAAMLPLLLTGSKLTWTTVLDAIGCRFSTTVDDTFITDSTVAVHDYYIGENPRAVLLVVNTSLSTASVPIKAFVSTPSQLLLR